MSSQKFTDVGKFLKFNNKFLQHSHRISLENHCANTRQSNLNICCARERRREKKNTSIHIDCLMKTKNLARRQLLKCFTTKTQSCHSRNRISLQIQLLQLIKLKDNLICHKSLLELQRQRHVGQSSKAVCFRDLETYCSELILMPSVLTSLYS